MEVAGVSRAALNSGVASRCDRLPSLGSSGGANVAPGLPFVTVRDAQFGSFQTNDS